MTESIHKTCQEYIVSPNERTLVAVERAIHEQRCKEIDLREQEKLSQMTDAEKHEQECHPDFEYTETYAPRKSDITTPPDGAWMLNPHKRSDRNGVFETDYWYRQKNPKPVCMLYQNTYYKVPSREWAYMFLWLEEVYFENNPRLRYKDVDKIIYNENEVDMENIVDFSALSIDEDVDLEYNRIALQKAKKDEKTV